ncbi:MAG TPA: DUF6714 family protein [Polyangia bacterium]|jgi:hypothetical protein|nr:DUF6714 family protein [Polyangia bacterium]
MDPRIDALKQQIADAFADVPYPGDDRLVDDPFDWEAADLLACFKGRHWKALTHEDLFQNSLTFVGLDAYSFYLPAYLLAALDDYEHSDHVVYGLCPTTDDPKLLEWDLRRFDRLNARQRAAVRSFLEYMRDQTHRFAATRKDIEEALAGYWAPKDPSDGGRPT